MSGILRDDREEAQLSTHLYLFGGRDSFLGKWGNEIGKFTGSSLAFWSCTYEQRQRVEKWVAARGDLTHRWDIELPRSCTDGKGLRTRLPKNFGHCHIYVCEPGHPALREGNS